MVPSSQVILRRKVYSCANSSVAKLMGVSCWPKQSVRMNRASLLINKGRNDNFRSRVDPSLRSERPLIRWVIFPTGTIKVISSLSQSLIIGVHSHETIGWVIETLIVLYLLFGVGEYGSHLEFPLTVLIIQSRPQGLKSRAQPGRLDLLIYDDGCRRCFFVPQLRVSPNWHATPTRLHVVDFPIHAHLLPRSTIPCNRRAPTTRALTFWSEGIFTSAEFTSRNILGNSVKTWSGALNQLITDCQHLICGAWEHRVWYVIEVSQVPSIL